LFFSWAKLGVGKFDGLTGITEEPGAGFAIWELFVAETVVGWVTALLFGSASGA